MRLNETVRALYEFGYTLPHRDAAPRGYDFELERFNSEGEAKDHLTHVFSGKPHTSKDGLHIHVKDRAAAMAHVHELFDEHDPDPNAGFANIAHKATGSKKGYAGVRERLKAHALAVIGQHFPAK